MAWVFLTQTHAFKMKKPVRYAFLDFSSLEKRRLDCREEVRLNRRLAPDVYLGTIPLTRHSDGAFELRGEGRPVEWLVRMRRLPRERFLDHAIMHRTWTPHAIEDVVRRLVAFHEGAPAEPMTRQRYRERLRKEIEENRGELLGTGAPAEHQAAVQRIAAAQLSFLESGADLLDARVQDSRIIEAHGDLRPEHVVLTDPPVVIDCLEFNRAFRILDPLDELAYFAMECERLGATTVSDIAIRKYAAASTGPCPPALLAFYGSCRALLRAKIALWHVGEDHVPDPERWLRRTGEYIALADQRLPAFSNRG